MQTNSYLTSSLPVGTLMASESLSVSFNIAASISLRNLSIPETKNWLHKKLIHINMFTSTKFIEISLCGYKVIKFVNKVN